MIAPPSDRPGGLQTLADKHGFSLEAVRQMLRALELGNGTMAQFDHPEFGGLGQWFSGGMVMVGRMNDHALKSRVSALCEELSASLPSIGWNAQSASSAHSSTFSSSGGFEWWPSGLGRPSSVGAQNTTRYAYFPDSHRLAVDIDGQQALYDTGPHVITGVSQQQGGSQTMRFSSVQGTVSLDDLKRVDRADTEPRPAPPPAPVPAPAKAVDPPPPPVSAPAPSPAAPPSPRSETDVFTILERLADLKAKGILTDEEFAAKKVELLARL